MKLRTASCAVSNDILIYTLTSHPLPSEGEDEKGGNRAIPRIFVGRGILKFMPDIPLEDDHYCFACGSENNDGLCVNWIVEGRTTRTEFIPPRKFQGWKNIVHGGIIATLLDEAMTRLAWIVCGGALTAEMNVRFLKPAIIGKKLFVYGEIVEEKRKLVKMKACVREGGPAGDIIANSEGIAVKTKSA